jgi:1-acyl-sn-glycerol-3-phosphate acyltransferase
MIAGILMRVVFDLKVRGKSNLPRTGGVLVISNHQSFLDPVVLAVMFDRPFAFLADAYLFKFKPFAWLIRKLNAFPIRTGQGDVGAMKETIRLLQSGQVLNVYPEGHRTPDGRLHKIEGGVALVIRRAKVPVLPAIIVGAYEAFPRHAVFPKAGKIRVIYDQPRRMDHLDHHQIVSQIQQSFEKLFEEARYWRECS